MPGLRNELATRVWHGLDPFEVVTGNTAKPDFQGWASDNPFLSRAIREVKPRIVAEVGVWKGGSVLTLASTMRELGLDGVVFAIDTWAGSSEHWTNSEWFSHLQVRGGRPTLYDTFAANIRERQLTDYVVPIPMDSLNAASLIAALGCQLDVMHLDGGHDFESVIADLRVWWPLIREGGVLIGDDYHPNGETWPDVRRAFHEFFHVNSLESLGGKCYVRKAAI